MKNGETNRAVSYLRLSNCDSNFIISLVFFYSFMISITSRGPDNVTSRLLRECANPITSPLSTSFNKGHGGGCFPKMCKVAN